MNLIDSKKRLGRIMDSQTINPKSKAGKAFIHAFWLGWMIKEAETEASPPSAYLTMTLMSGRYDELVILPTEE